MSKAKEITQRLQLHLNGGGAFSEYVYGLSYKGTEIGGRSIRYGKKPHRARELDVVDVKGDIFDVMEGGIAGLESFLNRKLEELNL